MSEPECDICLKAMLSVCVTDSLAGYKTLKGNPV